MKISPSAMRSRVESQNAPNFVTRPVDRAIVPSSRSLKTNAAITRHPVSSLPCVKKARKRSIMAAAGYRPAAAAGGSTRLRHGLRVVEHGLEGQLGRPDQRRVVAEARRAD